MTVAQQEWQAANRTQSDINQAIRSRKEKIEQLLDDCLICDPDDVASQIAQAKAEIDALSLMSKARRGQHEELRKVARAEAIRAQ